MLVLSNPPEFDRPYYDLMTDADAFAKGRDGVADPKIVTASSCEFFGLCIHLVLRSRLAMFKGDRPKGWQPGWQPIQLIAQMLPPTQSAANQ